MNLIMYDGEELTATMTTTFRTKRTEMTNERSGEIKVRYPRTTCYDTMDGQTLVQHIQLSKSAGLLTFLAGGSM